MFAHFTYVLHGAYINILIFDIVGTVYHLVIYMQSNKVHEIS